jgi:signal peptidase
VVATANLRAGDVITFRPPGHPAFVTHRIASVQTVRGRRVFTTKGDANRASDAWGAIALGDAHQARVAFHLPYLGYGIATLSQKRVRLVVIGVPALLIALAALAGLWRDSTPEPRPTQPA